jgi:uncharacterized membrane-anchored protein
LEPTPGLKVPAVTLGFWVIKILATTLGETGGDTLSMTYELGYLASSAIFVVPLVALIIAQVRARGFHPFLYWATIVASTTAGTTLADFATRSLGIGYPGGSLILLACVLLILLAWKASAGTIAIDSVRGAFQRPAGGNAAVVAIHYHQPGVDLLGRLHPHAAAGSHGG